jgi:DNA-binding MarR family transcriptional regulator
MGPKDLVIMLDLSPAAVTKVVDRLVELGDLKRMPHPHDRRAVYLIPTAAGAAKITRAYTGFHETLVDVVDALDEDTNNALHDGLLAVVDRLGQLNARQLVNS